MWSKAKKMIRWEQSNDGNDDALFRSIQYWQRDHNLVEQFVECFFVYSMKNLKEQKQEETFQFLIRQMIW